VKIFRKKKLKSKKDGGENASASDADPIADNAREEDV
jgi:hypothetical protein